jgi:predicted lipoprotein with Yx(FWY)xxD motif
MSSPATAVPRSARHPMWRLLAATLVVLAAVVAAMVGAVVHASAAPYPSSPYPAPTTPMVPTTPTSTTTSTTTVPPASSGVTVETEDNTQLGAILADGSGFTLYTLTNGTSPVLCTGTCATFWPPLVLPAGTAAPTAGPGVTGLGVTSNTNGTQVTAGGLPLYTFTEDTSPGQANGQGLSSFGGVWHVVKEGAAAAPACTPGPLVPAPSGSVTRLAGADRDATSVAVSQAAFPQMASASAVVLASDATYPDALAGTPLAVAKHAPLLLTTPSGLDPAIATEITRVLSPGGTVYLLGGDAALSSAIDSQVQALGAVPQRIAGSDRAATAVAIAGVLGDPPTVLLATGLDFPDGLSAGAAAASQAGAVLLTDGSAQAPETGAYLAAHANDTVFAVGGPAAAADPAATPLVGSDRFATAVTVAMKFFSAPAAVGFASGLDFPDALAGGAGIGAAHGPLLLVPACGALPASLGTYLGSVSSTVKTGALYGGTGVVGDDVLAALDQGV